MTDVPAGSALIELRGAAIGYGERPAVTGVDLELRGGEVVAVVGPNGAGKTTLVRGILGLARVLSGQVLLFGEPAHRFRQRYRIGYVPQRHTVGGAIPSTVQEVVATGRLPRKPLWGRLTRTDRLVVAESLETVGLTELRACPVSILSGGQQRRTLIARALAAQPDVLVMDEPTAGVDAASQAGLTRTLAGLVDRGMTQLIVTHEIAPLLPVLTRVVVVDAGRVSSDLPLEAALAAAGPPSFPAGVPRTIQPAIQQAIQPAIQQAIQPAIQQTIQPAIQEATPQAPVTAPRLAG